MATHETVITRILLVGDCDACGEDLRKLPASAGCEVTHVQDSAQASEALNRQAPDAVLIDIDMPGLDGVALVKAIHKEFPPLPIILLTAKGADDVAAVLRQGGTGYIRKRNAAREIVRTVGNVLKVARLRAEKKQALDSLQDAEFSFVLGNDVFDIPPLLSCVEQIASILHPCDPIERMRVNMALHEALLNAIQHGNLELNSELRQENEDIYRELGNERRRQAPYSGRRVLLRVTLSRVEAVYDIEDEGNGFDPSEVPDASDEDNLSRIGGRGLMLIRAFMDEVQFNENGNRVSLRKRYSTSHCSAQ